MAAAKERDSHFVLRLLVFAAFLIAVAVISWRFGPAIIRLMRRPAHFRDFVAAHGPLSVLIYIAIQVAHVIIIFIPGEIVQIAAGYAFGTALGTLYSFLGIALGTLIVFFATRLTGYALVKRFVTPRRLEEFDFLVAKPGIDFILFALFLIPGVPKDALVYISALTPIRPLRFLVISLVARFPGIWGAAYIGANLQRKNYLPVWLMSAAAVILFVAGVLARERIIRAADRVGNHRNHMNSDG